MKAITFHIQNALIVVVCAACLLSVGCSGNKGTNSSDPAVKTGTVTDIDGNIYKTVKIGDQWWMAENLKVTRYRDGSTIPNVADSSAWKDLTTGARCNYDNDENNVNDYGRLYNWYAATDERNIAPEGWHIPSNAEYEQLISYLGGEYVAGGHLKDTITWGDPSYSTNSSGFSAPAAGIRVGRFRSIGEEAHYWSSHDEFWHSGGDLFLHVYSVGSSIGSNVKSHGLSVRCIKNRSLPVVATTRIVDGYGGGYHDYYDNTSVGCGGVVYEEGDSPVTTRGVCWSSFSYEPTIADSVASIGLGVGAFRGYITGLIPHTTYYVRAFATNSNGTSYGDLWEFRKEVYKPRVEMHSVTNVTQTTAVVSYSITDTCGSDITQRGVVWSTNSEPTVADFKTIDGAGAGSFTSTMTGLIPGTPYYVRPYAVNNWNAVGYGTQRSFTTELPGALDSTGTVTDVDGNTYQTVKIGGQWWMAENLKVTHYRNGDPIPNVTNNTTWSNLTTGAYCAYNNNENNAETYGRLYNWYAVDDQRNIAPEGWHAPTDTEWQILVDYLGGAVVAGEKLKEAGTDHWYPSVYQATNESQFTALPGGERLSGCFVGMGGFARFWCSSEGIYDYALSRRLTCYDYQIYRLNSYKLSGSSVRCVKD